jgi:hypothetical protein
MGSTLELGLNMGVRLPQSLSVTSCPVFAGAGPGVAEARAKHFIDTFRPAESIAVSLCGDTGRT